MKTKRLVLEVGEVVQEHDAEIELMMHAIRFLIKEVRELKSKLKGV